MEKDIRPTAVHLADRDYDLNLKKRTRSQKAANKAIIQRLGADSDGAFRVRNRLDGKN
ncbi:hypothetical protein [Inquilinus limosus]|uniref:hypothetical protein n=1 Tax=Inquilinus limosus TaxID=171674 RepID=UPI00137738A9|nr:hypothetical protein [Inquilinus limosus]